MQRYLYEVYIINKQIECLMFLLYIYRCTCIQVQNLYYKFPILIFAFFPEVYPVPFIWKILNIYFKETDSVNLLLDMF